jgi:chitodextrinase
MATYTDIIERARELRGVIEDMAQELPDEAALTVVELFPAWHAGHTYAHGDRVRHEGVLYDCLQAHDAQETWAPGMAPSLWALVLIPDPDVAPEWVQPDSTNPYDAGDKVTHNGKTWRSLVDGNVWEPGVYGWEEVVE